MCWLAVILIARTGGAQQASTIPNVGEDTPATTVTDPDMARGFPDGYAR